VGKLVLSLADGRTAEVRLDKERITIGRRADNDVCLPHVAVSGEHAAVVTIASDSFLEDLRSTNGTLVNRTPVTTRRLLRDGDEIDIGRERLVYFSDDDALPSQAADSGARSPGRRDADRAAAPSALKPGGPTLSGAAEGDLAARAEPGLPPYTVSAPVPDDASPISLRAIDRFVAAEVGDPREGAAASGEAGKVVAPVAATPSVPIGKVPAGPHPTGVTPAHTAPPALIRVRTGPGAGRHVVLDKDKTSIGRIGVQAASICREGGGFRIVPTEGALPPLVNGVPLPPPGVVLRGGDVLEIAGACVEFVAPEAAQA